MSGDAMPTVTQQRKNLQADYNYYRDMMNSSIPEERERGSKRLDDVIRAQHFVDGCSNCGEPFANHPGLWALRTNVIVGERETMVTGEIFEVCYILKRLEDRTNYLGHKVEPADPCDEEHMKDIGS